MTIPCDVLGMTSKAAVNYIFTTLKIREGVKRADFGKSRSFPCDVNIDLLGMTSKVAVNSQSLQD